VHCERFLREKIPYMARTVLAFFLGKLPIEQSPLFLMSPSRMEWFTIRKPGYQMKTLSYRDQELIGASREERTHTG